jgi:hypothetical protein
MSRRALVAQQTSSNTFRSPQKSPSPTDNALQPQTASTASAVAEASRTLVAYIPTEVVAVYVAGAAAIDDPAAGPAGGQWVLFWVILALTPIAAWTGLALTSREAGVPLPLAPMSWPIPEMILSSAAFCVWAFSLPGSPFGQFEWFRPAMGAGVLLVGTFVISVIGSLVRPIRAAG